MIGVIPAAGKGTRFKELGKQYAKAILPYKEKPILIHQIEWLRKNGCTDIRVIVNHQEDTIKDILSFYKEDVSLIRQEEQNGLSGAVYSAIKDDELDSRVLVVLGDIIVGPSELSKEDLEYNWVSITRVEDYSRWCMVDIEGTTLKFIDKPTERPETNWALDGVYYFTSSSQLKSLLADQLSSGEKLINDEYQLSTVLQKIANKYGMGYKRLSILDFGTLDEYLKHRGIKNSRSFNEIISAHSSRFVTKASSSAREKIVAEINWFNNLPDPIKVHTPRIFSYDLYGESAYYVMEKILAPTLREVYVFLDSSEETWDSIFDSIFEVLHAMKLYGKPNSFMDSVIKKNYERVKSIDIPIENKLVYDFLKEFDSSVRRSPALMHGDFCFSNILYDFNSSTIKMIDPRGELFGDHYYEVAKICHSVFWDYDIIDCELYVVENGDYRLYSNGKETVKKLLADRLTNTYNEDELQYIKMLTASLFLTMIPLHSHNKTNQKLYYDVFKKCYATVNTDKFY